MHRRTSSKNRLLKKILEFSLSFVKAVVRTSRSFIRFATKQLLFELFLATVVIGLSYLFTIWGISQNIALWLAVAVVLGLLLVAIYIFSKLERNKRPNENKFRGEIGLAWWISQTFAEKKLGLSEAVGELDLNKTNVNGGAIALGHPLGMSGARILHTAALELHEQDKRYALCTLCVGVGQGYATVLERV